MTYDALKHQTAQTISNLEHGTISRSDRIFLTHLLEQVEFLLDSGDLEKSGDLTEHLRELIGSTKELVEDGLEN